MKKFILNITLLCGFSFCIYSQTDCNPSYSSGPNVSTCNSFSSVATVEPSCEWSDPQIASLKSGLLASYGTAVYGSNGISSSDLLALATTQYNCHAYAWHLTEGNLNEVWINGSTGFKDSNGCYISNNNPISFN